MNWFLNSCRRHRESLCLLASDRLPEPDRTGLENHLAQCVDCRNYYDGIKAVTAPLAGWERHFAHVEPSAAAHLRWMKASAPAGRSEVSRPFAPKIVLLECWRQLIWPSRRIWTGLAAVWVLLVVVNVSQRDTVSSVTGKPVHSPAVMMSWQVQQRWMNDLLADRSAAPETDRPRNTAPKPHTQNCEITAV